MEDLIMGNRIVAMIPVRAGSVRVEGKNTRNFADTNLLELKLKAVRQLSSIDRVIVSTDCNKAASIANKYGVDVQWRDTFYAGSNVTNDQHWKHIAETTPGEIVFMAQTTSPLVRASTMQNAIDRFNSEEQVTSINSVSSEKKFLWQDGRPINYDASNTPKSQDLPDIVSLNFAITIISREEMIKRENVIGKKPEFIQLDKIESLDVDDHDDFQIAESMYKNRGLDWLLS